VRLDHGRSKFFVIEACDDANVALVAEIGRTAGSSGESSRAQTEQDGRYLGA
jgi:hypothetical protein